MKGLNLRLLFKRYSVPRVVAAHLIGEQHTIQHRMAVGTVIAISGVLVSKLAHAGPLHILTDGIGYLIHAIGGTPFAEYFLGLGKHHHIDHT